MPRSIQSTWRAVQRIWTRLGIRAGEDPAATICRQLVDRYNNELIDGERLAQGDPEHLAYVQTLLGIVTSTNGVTHITNVPENEHDFSMFPNETAPTTGYYKASDSRKEWTFKAGWSQWRFVDLSSSES